ncbi:MAG: hypothetical protein COV44_08015 [Deltaproteobacteria bacterium CG11_big_fil_rev_8_21_14_0_20_45_16]|nr:MAG: hypothetical protein COV44_08015 [Deltaproteobacteria bacterium CG11_big_fil_rev_8_21_14_0_20_45_16]
MGYGRFSLVNAVKLQERIMVVSDGTGDTAESYVQAVLAQFKLPDTKVTRHPKIQSKTEFRKLLDSIKAPYLVAYTFAAQDLRKKAWSLIRDRKLTGIDLLYPAVEIFSSFLQTNPTQATGALHSTQASDYFERIEAIEFTVKHDDGMKLNELSKADIVLVGVSRSSKTPTSIFLAHKGYKVANVPLVPGIDAPKELLDAHEQGVPIVFLTISPIDLERIRKVRFQNLRKKDVASSDNYINAERIREELESARQLARRHGWPILDVTDKAIEESASEILLLVNARSS